MISILLILLASSILNCYGVDQFGLTTLPTASSSGSSWARGIYEYDNGVLLGGYFSATVNFQGVNVTSTNNGNDMFLVKYSSINLDTIEWMVTYGGTGSDVIFDVVADTNHNIIFVGSLSGSANYGGGAFTSNSVDAVIVKLNSARQHVWSKVVGGPGIEYGSKVATDPINNILVFGTAFCSGTPLVTSWGGADLTCEGIFDMVVAKYSSDGTFLWSQLIGGSSSEDLGDIATDFQGNIAIIGSSISPSIVLNGQTYTNVGSDDLILVKYLPNGSVAWAKYLASTTSELGKGVAFDSSGNLLITGTFMGPLDFGGGSITAKGSDAFLVKYASDGTFVWNRTLGDQSTDSGWSVRVAYDDSIFLGGLYRQTPVINGISTLKTSASDAAFLAKYSTAGVIQWAVGFPSQISPMQEIYIAPFKPGIWPPADGTFMIGYFDANITDLNNQTVVPKGSSQNTLAAAVGYVVSPSPTPSVTPSITPSTSASPSVTPSASVTPTVTPSLTPTPTTTPSASVTPTITPTTSPSAAASPSSSRTPSTSSSAGSGGSDSSGNVLVIVLPVVLGGLALIGGAAVVGYVIKNKMANKATAFEDDL